MIPPPNPPPWGIVGHADAVETLAAAVASQRVAHAWLITGPVGVGRTTLALVLAKALNCQSDPEARPCGVCPACRKITAGSHPDVLLADMAWQREFVGGSGSDKSRSRQRFSIDAIRLLRADIVTRPINGRWKVQILDAAGLFSQDAPEAFLKTLEEPPPFAVIVLVADSPEQVPDTIRSRCRHVALGLVKRREIADEMIRRGADAALADRISRIARGRVAWAIAALDTPDALLRRGEAIESAFEHLITPLGRAAIAGVISASHSQRRDVTYELLDLWLGFWRDALYMRVGLSEQTYYPEVSDRLADWSRDFSVSAIHRAMTATKRCMLDLDTNMQARIALQAMVTQWPG